MSTQRYYALTREQKLALSSEQLLQAVNLEAVERGISPPTRLSDQLRSIDAKGFSIPPEATRFFELMAPANTYGEGSRTGIAFQTEELAKAALEHAFSVVEEGYDAKRTYKMGDPAKFGIRCVYVTNRVAQGYWTKLEALKEDTEKYDELCEECRVDLEKVRQDDYNQRVTQTQRAQYLELAGGNADIAAAFWLKTKGTPFPPETNLS